MALDGKVALVTGASRGIGRATALRLARDGASVAVHFHKSQAAADEVVQEILQLGRGQAIAAKADMANAEEISGMVLDISARLGAPSILVNNAGLMLRADLGNFDAAGLERMRAVNVDGLIRMTASVAEGMKQTGWGRIVNLSSIAARGTAMEGTTFYAATKAAVLALTRRFAMDLGPYGITVNAVAPGFIWTDMTRGGQSEAGQAAIREKMGGRSMTGRVGTPDVAHAISFLTSLEAGFITAQTLTVDGGRMDYLSGS